MFGELNVRLSSIKKQIIVRRTVRSVIGEQTFRRIKNGLKGFCSLQPSRIRVMVSVDVKRRVNLLTPRSIPSLLGREIQKLLW